jgi:very-short-patch-repair endonuclease
MNTLYDTSAYWDQIRRFYQENHDKIMSTNDKWGIDPNAWRGCTSIHMTPIEDAIWSEIRQHGAILYPQYPVAGYFVDFGNPIAKVAIECDGAAYHQNKAKDAARQAAIEANGWRVFRLTGSQCVHDDRIEIESDDGEPQFEPSPAAELIVRLIVEHGAGCARRFTGGASYA